MKHAAVPVGPVHHRGYAYSASLMNTGLYRIFVGRFCIFDHFNIHFDSRIRLAGLPSTSEIFGSKAGGMSPPKLEPL
jgi:hypothetical protein